MPEKETDFGTIIGADATLKGDLKFNSAAKVLGNVEGSISSDGLVLIANGSKCKATVKAKEVSVEGKVEGNVEATERVEIKANGAINGDITAAKMTMADGASIDGYIRIGANGKATSAAEVKPTSSHSSAPEKATASAKR